MSFKWNKNDAPRWIFVGLWIVVNVIIFVVTFFRYKDDDEYYYLRTLIGNSLCWARGSAACLNFNIFLILLPVCRKLLSYIRGCCDCFPQVLRRQLDKNVTYHKYIAYMICIHTAIHVSAHVFNFERLADAQRVIGDDIRAKLSKLPSSPNGTWVNPIRSSDPDPTQELFQTVAGVSGVVITLSLVIIVSSSTEIIRRSYFEMFWFTHHIFIIFFIGFIVHGSQMIIHRQTNISSHPVLQCQDKKWGTRTCATPQFEGTPPNSWKWLIFPAFLYLLERFARLVSSWQRVVVTKVVTHPSRVYELQMKKAGFGAGPGQYVLLQCPQVSRLEWHPFTLTSAPGDDYFSVHIRRVGDWTEAVAKLCHVDEGEFQEAWKMPRINVDGPFGTSTEDVFGYDVAILVGTGIGVTPFASVLKSVWYKFCDPKATVSLKKVYLYWVCPDTKSFEWFRDLLLDLERQMRQQGTPNFLQYNIHLTRGWNVNQARNIMLHDDYSVYDVVTGLHHKTHYGRPQWDTIFQEHQNNHKGEQIGVFFCGPAGLSRELHKNCNKYSDPDSRTYFFYNKENF